jgi:hypothetical protein
MVNLPKADRHFDVERNILHFMSRIATPPGLKLQLVAQDSGIS